MKDLGLLQYFLGIEITSSPKGYLLSQTKYITDILHRANLTDGKTVDTPLELHVKFSATDGVLLEDPTLYRELVGCLVYLTVTRPDISYVVHIISQYVSCPCSTQLGRIVTHSAICSWYYSSESPAFVYLELDILRAYVDANWDGDVSNRKSTSGFCVFLGDSLVSWKSKKQSVVVARSTAEAEYRVHGSCYLRNYLASLALSSTSSLL
ncbi:hypothetical protein Acr_00g0103390 [Actinidia rufa]|uniref:Reverse transcriptase Ty1/copia-type domain-containing protein n=1 Tax=Actinidia rufa TaxID=165716 RepID=A0A7J0E0K3_9ERIC|nr:hypothetical protein Acr_00g0103390 [Actinidia rufa]